MARVRHNPIPNASTAHRQWRLQLKFVSDNSPQSKIYGQLGQDVPTLHVAPAQASRKCSVTKRPAVTEWTLSH